MPLLNGGRPKQRTVGPSRDPSTTSLLKNISPRPGKTSRPKTPEDVDAPPIDLSSSDESEILSESGNSSSKVRRSADSGSKASNINITKTKFEVQEGSPSEDKSRSLRGHDRQTAKSATLKGKRKAPSDNEDDLNSARQSPAHSSKKKSRPPLNKSEDGSMEDLTNLYQHRVNRSARGYGNKGLMRTRAPPQRAREMIVPAALSPGPERVRPTLRTLPSESPSPERERKELILPSVSPTRERKVALKTDGLFDSPPAKGHMSKRIVTKPDSDSPQLSPRFFDDDAELMAGVLSKRASTTIEETCPMCYLPVDRELLRSFSKGKPLTMRQQMKFCNLHKEQSAKDVWKKRGYPSIDWSGMNRRLKRHHRLLGQIINGEESHYRTDLAEKLAKGEERTLRKTERSLAPGYYGNRGLRLMSEHIIQHFSERLRKKAVDDPVISGRGTTVFVSKVLVPELATRLIMEDMSVGLGEARAILLQSVDMGELLQDDVADGEVDAAETLGDHYDSMEEF